MSVICYVKKCFINKFNVIECEDVLISYHLLNLPAIVLMMYNMFIYAFYNNLPVLVIHDELCYYIHLQSFCLLLASEISVEVNYFASTVSLHH